MYHHRKFLLLIILLNILLISGGCSAQLPDSNPKAEAGIMDLTQLQFEYEVVQLNGKWEFYWSQLLDPSEMDTGVLTGYIDIPSSWNKYITNEESRSKDGYATYRLTFITDENESLALKIPRLRSAYKLWVNGELIASAGTVGKTRDTVIPQYLAQVASFKAQQGNNEIVI